MEHLPSEKKNKQQLNKVNSLLTVTKMNSRLDETSLRVHANYLKSRKKPYLFETGFHVLISSADL